MAQGGRGVWEGKPVSPGKWNEVLLGLSGIEGRPAVLGVETGIADLDKMSGM